MSDYNMAPAGLLDAIVLPPVTRAERFLWRLEGAVAFAGRALILAAFFYAMLRHA